MKCRNIGDPNEILLAALHIHSLHTFAGFVCNVHLRLWEAGMLPVNNRYGETQLRDAILSIPSFFFVFVFSLGDYSLTNNHSLRVYEGHHFSNRVLLRRRQPVTLTNEPHPAPKVLQRAGKTIEKSYVR